MPGSINSQYFHVIGDKLINPIVGVYISIIRIPYYRWEVSHPQYKEFRPWLIWTRFFLAEANAYARAMLQHPVLNFVAREVGRNGPLEIPTNLGLTDTLTETNSHFAPENGWLEDEFPFGVFRPIFRC